MQNRHFGKVCSRGAPKRSGPAIPRSTSLSRERSVSRTESFRSNADLTHVFTYVALVATIANNVGCTFFGVVVGAQVEHKRDGCRSSCHGGCAPGGPV